MYLALKKCKNDCKILKITLVQNFVPQNLKLVHLLSDFILISIPAVYVKIHTYFIKFILIYHLYQNADQLLMKFHTHFMITCTCFNL